MRAGDLRQADHADITGVAPERLAHLLIDALRLDRHVVEVALAQHRALAILARRGPGLALLQLAGFPPFLGNRDEQFKRGLGIGDDAEIGIEDASDLGRLDIDMHEGAALGVGLDRPGVPVGPAVADAEHEVGFQHGRIAVAMAGLQSDHSRHQHVVVRNGAPAHQRRHHRNIDDLGERHQQVGCIGIDDAAARHDQRTLRGIEHIERLLDLLARGGRLVDRQRLVGFVVEFDFRQLHVERQIDQHRTGTSRTHDVERLAEDARHQRRFAHGHRPFRHRLGDRLDIDGLKVFLVEARARRLPGDAKDRDRIRDRRIKTGDHVGAGRARCADADADIAGLGAGVALRHVRGALDVARQNVVDRAALLQGGIQRIDRGAGNTEGANNAFLFQNTHGSIDCSHLRHFTFPLISSGAIITASDEPSQWD